MTGRTAEGFLRTQLWEYDSPHFRWSNPSLYTGEAIFGVIVLLQEQTPVVQRLDLVAARLDAIPACWRRPEEHRACAGRLDRAGQRESAAALLLLGDGLDRYLAEHGQEHIGVRTRCRGGQRVRGVRRVPGARPAAARDRRVRLRRDTFEMLLREAHFLDTDAAGLEARALEQMAAAEAALVAGAAAVWSGGLAGCAGRRWRTIHPTAEQFPSRFAQLWHAPGPPSSSTIS